jgi:hypothetical protein
VQVTIEACAYASLTSLLLQVNDGFWIDYDKEFLTSQKNARPSQASTSCEIHYNIFESAALGKNEVKIKG